MTGDDATTTPTDPPVAAGAGQDGPGEPMAAGETAADATAAPSPDVAANAPEGNTPEDGGTAAGGPDDVRGRLVRQFERWVDRMLAGEPAPAGLPPDVVAEALEAAGPSQAGTDGPGGPPPLEADLYAVVAAVTALTGEVRLQGRAFKQLADTLAPVADAAGRLDDIRNAQALTLRRLVEMGDALSDQAAAAAATAGDESEAAAGPPLPAAEDVLAVLFDLHDRLEIGLRVFDMATAAAEAAPPPPSPADGWRGRLRALWGGGPSAPPAQAAPAASHAATKAMREGYQMTLSRVEAALRQWGIERTAAPGDPFDPQVMSAVDVGPAADGSPDGTVLEVYRNGYALHGRVLATAQVKVAKAGPPGRGGAGGDSSGR